MEPPQQTPKRLSFAPLAAPVLIIPLFLIRGGYSRSYSYNTGGYEPPFFRERGAFPLCSGNANPLRFPPQRKGGSPKISAFLEKRGNGPKVGLVPGMTKPPTPQKCPFPLRVPTFVPGLLRPRFCSPFWFPLPFLVSLGAVCSGFRSPNEKTQKWRAPRAGGCRKKGRRGPGLALRVRVRESQPEYEARGHAKRRARHALRMPATTWLAADTHTHLARLWLLLELDRQDMSASEQGRTRSKLRGTREGRALLVSAALSDWLRSAIGNHSNPGERIRSRPFHGRLSAPFLTPPRATVATFELVPQKALRGANRTSAVPVLPLVAVPHKCTIDPRRPTLSGRKGSLAVCGYDRRSCPTTTRTESSGEWRRKRKLLCEARKSERALIVGSRSAQIGLDEARGGSPRAYVLVVPRSEQRERCKEISPLPK